MTQFVAASRLIEAELNSTPRHWVVAYSGGKDSSLVLCLFWSLAVRGRIGASTIGVLYCDTGSENPFGAKMALETLKGLECESRQLGIPVTAHVVQPSIERRLMVRIAGRGYPPPNTFFRWCTKDIRVRPVATFLSSLSSEDNVVVLGVRRDESQQRRRSLAIEKGRYWSEQREGVTNLPLFMPIVDLTVQDVWDGLDTVPGPSAMHKENLWDLYKDASAECPVIKTPDDPPCGQGRFGCWLCTVVRRDRSAERMVAAGRSELQPLLDFRSWLLEIRNDVRFRCTVRRNGREALGPFRLSARREILARVQAAENLSGFTLVSAEELRQIALEWHRDITNPKYQEDFR